MTLMLANIQWFCLLCASLGNLFSSYCTDYIFLVCFKRYFIYTVRAAQSEDLHVSSASSSGTATLRTKLGLVQLSWCIC